MWRAGVGIAAIAVAALIGGTVWLHSLHPLETTSGFWGTSGPVTYRTGGVITVEIPIRNSSPLRVRLLGLAAERPDYGLLETVSAALVRGGRSTPLGRSSLAAGASGELVTRLRFANCQWSDANSGNELVQLPVRWHVFGLTRTSWLQLHQPVTVASPAVCPGRPENQFELTPSPGRYPIARTVPLRRRRGVDSGYVRLAIKRRSPTAFDVDVRLVGRSKDGYDVDAYVTAEHLAPGVSESDGTRTTNFVLPKGERANDHWRTVVTGVQANCVELSVSRQEGTTSYGFASTTLCDRARS